MAEQELCSFQVSSWDEKPYEEIEGGAKLTRAQVTQTYSGVIEGNSAVEYLMFHRSDKSAVFVGIERITGKVGGRSGGFVIQHDGKYVEGIAKSNWIVVSGSGTGDLIHLQGTGSFAVGHSGKASVTFDYTIA